MGNGECVIWVCEIYSEEKQRNYLPKSILEALKSLELQEKDIVLITGSLYLAGEVLNLN